MCKDFILGKLACVLRLLRIFVLSGMTSKSTPFFTATCFGTISKQILYNGRNYEKGPVNVDLSRK